MRKDYIIPYLTVDEAQCTMVLAVSIINGEDADPNKPVLGKENVDWDIWSDE